MGLRDPKPGGRGGLANAAGAWTPVVSNVSINGGGASGTVEISQATWFGDNSHKKFLIYGSWTPPDTNPPTVTQITFDFTFPEPVTDFYGDALITLNVYNSSDDYYGNNCGAGNMFVSTSNPDAPYTRGNVEMIKNSWAENRYTFYFMIQGVLEI